jgi:hypothetical protein
MKQVPNWQWFMLFYLLIVALPILLLSKFLKQKRLTKPIDLLIYFVLLIVAAYLLHLAAMFIYYKFFFLTTK